MAGRPRKSAQVALDPRNEIVAAASRLFARRGISATTMAEVAEEAGLAASSVYYWFRSKQQILEVLVEDVNRAPLEFAESMANGGGSVADRLRLLIQFDVETLCGYPFDINEVHRLAAGDDPELARYWADRQRLIDAVERLVREGIARGELREVDPRLAALTILANDEASQNWYRLDGTRSPAEVAAFIAELGVQGLSA